MKQSKHSHFLHKNGVILLILLIAAVSTAVLYSIRIMNVYVDNTVFNGFSMLLLWLSIADTLLLLVLYFLKTKGVQHNGKPFSHSKLFAVLYGICIGITFLFFLYDTIMLLTTGIELRSIMRRLFLASLPYLAAVCSILFLLFIFPQIKNGIIRKSVSVVMTVCVLASGLLTLYPCYSYKITSDPMVIDSGNTYSIVFATNDTGTGYVEYTYNGESYKEYDESAGRIKGDSKIHTIQIPKAHLDNNSYRVGSKRVLEELSYGGRSGKEVVSQVYDFTAPAGSEQTYLTVSDWHLRLEQAYAASSYAGDYDGVILLGDAAPGLMFEEEIVENIVEFGGTLSKGSMPIIYLRGNHETRGGYASKLADCLGMDSFYYTTDYGDYHFLALDSGEDKQDDHAEYGGMVNYAQYRKDMVEWLKTLPESDKKTITLVHDSDICVEEDLRASAQAELKRLDATEILSGHYHVCEFKQENGFNIYIDGGHGNGGYIASKLTLHTDNYRLEAWNNSGEKVFDKTLDW